MSAFSLGKILCPTDFSEFSEYALEHALGLSSSFGATITAIHVVPQTLMHPELFPYMKEPVLPRPEIRELAEERLKEFVTGFGAGIEYHVESGDAARRILMRAESLPADLIVIGSHGRSGFRRWLLGSVTEKVIRQASTPVLMVSRRPEAELYPRILCAVDFSECSIDGVGTALALTEASRGELILAHVVEGDYDLDEETLMRRLASSVPRSPPAGSRFDFVVVKEGTPHREIARLAKEREANLVVVGGHGLGGSDASLMGSTANQLIRTAPCPVWVHHESNHQAMEE